MSETKKVYNYLVEKLSKYGVIPLYMQSIENGTIHIFDFPCNRDFHRISYYSTNGVFKYYKLPIDCIRNKSSLKNEIVEGSRLIIQTHDIYPIQEHFKRSAKLEFQCDVG